MDLAPLEGRKVKPVELPGALCVGIPEAFELAGKTPKQIRRAVNTCARCPALEPCAADPSVTVDMVRAGRVYGTNGQPHRWRYTRGMFRMREGSADAEKVEAT